MGLLLVNPFAYLAIEGGALFFLVVVMKLTKPYSNKLLKLLNLWSKNKTFRRCVLLLFVIWFLIVSLAPALTSIPISIDWFEALVVSIVALISGVIGAGMLIAIMRFSYEYIGGDEDKNKKKEF